MSNSEPKFYTAFKKYLREGDSKMEYASRFKALAEILERIGAQVEMEDGEPKVRKGIKVRGENPNKVYFLYSNGDFGMGPQEEEKLLGVFPLKIGGLEFYNPIYYPYEVEYDGDNASSAMLSFQVRWT